MRKFLAMAALLSLPFSIKAEPPNLETKPPIQIIIDDKGNVFNLLIDSREKYIGKIHTIENFPEREWKLIRTNDKIYFFDDFGEIYEITNSVKSLGRILNYTAIKSTSTIYRGSYYAFLLNKRDGSITNIENPNKRFLLPNYTILSSLGLEEKLFFESLKYLYYFNPINKMLYQIDPVKGIMPIRQLHYFSENSTIVRMEEDIGYKTLEEIVPP